MRVFRAGTRGRAGDAGRNGRNGRAWRGCPALTVPFLVLAMAALALAAVAAAAAPAARFVRFAEVRSIVDELSATLPPEIGALPEAQRDGAWPAWIERHDTEIRARLARGDEDTIVNWLLFGTSFTDRPRAILGSVESGGATDQNEVLRRTIELITARLEDLLRALTTPGADERRLFARALLERQGLSFATPEGRDAVRAYLLQAVLRVAQEQDQIDQTLQATTSGDASAEFVLRSRLFQTRGLSLDTSLLPNYSIEQSLAAMKTRGLLKPGRVKRVAIVGPGLDFTDKDSGFDFYPQQTLQPFAVIDALRRLGLAPASAGPEIVVLDISPRVLDHVAKAKARAARGLGYTLNLPLPKTKPWLPEVRKYWETFGDQIGTRVQGPTSKAIAAQADLRAVRVPPSAVQRLSAMDLNIVTQRLDGEAFDLVIATNVFIYYNVLEQALAMANIEAMLKPDGFLLANFAAPDLRSLTIRQVDSLTTHYSGLADNAEYILDVMVWYKPHADLAH